MEITFANTKDMECYEAFVCNPDDRTCRRKFCKKFSPEIASDAEKRHGLLVKYPSALAYNQVYGSTDNRIEIKRGTKDKEELVLKVRVSGSYRKFFHFLQVEDNGDKTALKTKDWKGQFGDVEHIYVFDVNKHNYNN